MFMTLRRRRRRSERGAVAIMVALGSVVMLAMCAMTVDLGQAYVAVHDVQKSADFSALAGGLNNDLPSPATSVNCTGGANRLLGPQAVASSQAVKDVVSYLNSNPYNFNTKASKLTDCNMTNGEVIFGFAKKGPNNQWTESYDKNKLTVVTPPRNVGFGFAAIMGFNSVNVVRTATVQIFSPMLNRTLPFYAAEGCDYGEQTIAQPSNGTAVSSVILANGSDTGGGVETGLVTTPATTPATVGYPLATPTPLEIDGSGFTGATQIGFFESGATSPGPAPTTLPIQAGWINAAGTKIVIPDISSLALAQDTWYVRVMDGTNGQWSKVATGKKSDVLNALPLTVGAPNLYCTQGSSQGNFGSLLLPNSLGPTGQTDNIAYNIAAGLQHSLAIFPTPGNPADYTCSSSVQGSVLWVSGPGGPDGVNCVDTKTGHVAADAAWEGLLNGVGGKPGLLTNVGANTGCASNGVPATTVWQTFNINNDSLSCFFKNSTTTIGDVDSQSYALSGPAFNVSIYTSPRFVYIPVLGVTPTTGGSKKYQIIDLRPAFISDQPNSATQSTPEVACTPLNCNGLTMGNNPNTLQSLQLILLNPASLPTCPDSICKGVQQYLGTGPKALRIIN
jgi:hypothetical protein